MLGKMQKIWLDTDIGSDIDDALALAFLLSRPDCEVVGISTVTEVENLRAKLCSCLCRIARKHVPIFPGIGRPLLVSPRQTQVPQAHALENWAHDDKFSDESAVFAMRRYIRAHPGEVTLLAIGPLTNVAVLFAIDPEIPSLLRELVLMCGSFERRGTEWNAMLDPEATAIVYANGPETFTSFGLDVTTKVQLTIPEATAMLDETEIGRCVHDMSRAWKSETITFHDPLAAAAIFEPSLVTFARGNVEIELISPKLKGLTHFERRSDGPHLIADKVNADRFFEVYFENLRDFKISG